MTILEGRCGCDDPRTARFTAAGVQPRDAPPVRACMSACSSEDCPAWWSWEIEFTSHVIKRMVQRGFSEIDLRSMLANVSAVRPSEDTGRWVVATSLGSHPWTVIVEPDPDDRLLVVITAYPVDVS